jgi:protein TonB
MLSKHISQNFRYPMEAQKRGIQGVVHVIFIISKTGEITDIKIKGPHDLLNNEALRIVKRLPKMEPGKLNGTPVRVPFSFPITFKLQ